MTTTTTTTTERKLAMTTNYLDRVRAIPGVTVGTPSRIPGDEWQDYLVTVSRGDRSYPVAVVTEFDNGTPPQTMRVVGSYDHLATVRRVLSRMQDAAGVPTDREARFQATYGFFNDTRGYED